LIAVRQAAISRHCRKLNKQTKSCKSTAKRRAAISRHRMTGTPKPHAGLLVEIVLILYVAFKERH